jgi:Lrp/AsnC family leucine-responsive transcriptional regulator
MMSGPLDLDDTDLQILDALQENARISNAEIARRLGMAPSAILERIRKLEARGVILGYRTQIDPAAVGRGLLAFVFVRVDERLGESLTGDLLAGLPGVLEVHHIAGEDCYLAKVRAEDTANLGLLLRERLGSVPTVHSTRTTIVLETVKETGRLPLPRLEEGAHETLETDERSEALEAEPEVTA